MYETEPREKLQDMNSDAPLDVIATSESKKTTMGKKFKVAVKLTNKGYRTFSRILTLKPKSVTSFIVFDGFEGSNMDDQTKIDIKLSPRDTVELVLKQTVPYGVLPGDYTFTWKFVDCNTGTEVGPLLVLNQTLCSSAPLLVTKNKALCDLKEEKANQLAELGFTDGRKVSSLLVPNQKHRSPPPLFGNQNKIVDESKEEKVNRLAQFGFTDRAKVIQVFEKSNWNVNEGLDMLLRD